MIVKETKLKNAKLLKRGKVRDIYDLGEHLLIVSTDRISAFDFVLKSLIPCKGKVLNQISLFWFDMFKDDFKNHIVTGNIDDFPEKLKEEKEILEGRAVIVKKLNPIPFECIVRGYITGSGWKSYKEKGEISGIKLPQGLKESEKFKEPIFTPTTKAETGHDLPVTIDDMKNALGTELAEKLKDISIQLYKRAEEYALKKGIIIADTKFEFAVDDEGNIVIIDEIFTPDSSRFWKKENYEPGKPQESYDKQFVRNFLLNSSWDRKSTPPPLPEDIVEKTSSLYKEIFKILTGKEVNC